MYNANNLLVKAWTERLNPNTILTPRLISSAAFFPDLRMRMECSKHVNSFIDAY